MYENLTENDKQILLNTYNMWCHLAKYGCMGKSDYPGYEREIMNLTNECGYCHVIRKCRICPLYYKDNPIMFKCCGGYWFKWVSTDTAEKKFFYATKIRDMQAEFLREIGVLPAGKPEERK